MRAVRPRCSFSKLDESCSRPVAGGLLNRLAQDAASACKTIYPKECDKEALA